MQRALLLASWTALAAAGVARADDPTTNDIRCIVVAGSLAQSSDADLQKLGGVSLLYFWGRLEGRGATGNIDAKVADAATKMTADDVKQQAPICGAMVSAAGQSLQDLGNAMSARIGGGAGGK